MIFGDGHSTNGRNLMFVTLFQLWSKLSIREKMQSVHELCTLKYYTDYIFKIACSQRRAKYLKYFQFVADRIEVQQKEYKSISILNFVSVK
jgi:hypothetical protein